MNLATSSCVNLRSPRGPIRYASIIPRSDHRLSVLGWTCKISATSLVLSIIGGLSFLTIPFFLHGAGRVTLVNIIVYTITYRANPLGRALDRYVSANLLIYWVATNSAGQVAGGYNAKARRRTKVVDNSRLQCRKEVSYNGSQRTQTRCSGRPDD